jgi:hypothetical protein
MKPKTLAIVISLLVFLFIVLFLICAFVFESEGNMIVYRVFLYFLVPAFTIVFVFVTWPLFSKYDNFKEMEELQTFLDALFYVSHRLEQPIIDALETAAAKGDWEYTRQLIQEVQTDYDVNLDYLYSKTPGQTITKETVL